MKRSLVFFIAFFFFGFSKTDNPGLKLKATKIQPLSADKCTVALELHNVLGQKINYLSMYCSYDDFYTTDNPNVRIMGRECDKNFPITKTIARNTYQSVNLKLEIAKEIKEAKFRIGFKFVDVPIAIDLVNYDSTKMKSVTIWSNTIEYKKR